jgi:hypothetical protein
MCASRRFPIARNIKLHGLYVSGDGGVKDPLRFRTHNGKTDYSSFRRNLKLDQDAPLLAEALSNSRIKEAGKVLDVWYRPRLGVIRVHRRADCPSQRCKETAT